MNKLIAWYCISGANAELERSYLRVDSVFDIAVSGSTAIATIESQMYVKRDSYGPTGVGPSYNPSYEKCYITIDGIKVDLLKGWNEDREIGTSFVKIGKKITHTIKYPAAEGKTVAISAGFSMTSSGSSKLRDLVIPTSKYPRGKAGIESGSQTLKLPPQITNCKPPSSVVLSPAKFDDSLTLSWRAGASGTANTLSSYEIYKAVKVSGKWSGWSAYKTISSKYTSLKIDPSIVAHTGSVKFRIRSRGSAGASYCSSWVESAEAYRVPEKLTPPKIEVTAPFDKTITISWSGAEGKAGNAISSYYIMQKNKAPAGEWTAWTAVTTVETNKTSGEYNFTPPNAAYIYQFAVRAQGTAGASYYSLWVYSEETKKNTKPTAPTSFNVSDVLVKQSETVTLNWSGASDPDGNIEKYQIYKSVNGQARVLLQTVAGQGGSGSYDYLVVDAIGDSIIFSLRAVDSFGYESALVSSEAVVVNEPPHAPSSLIIQEKEIGPGDILHLKWTGASDPDANIAGYRIGFEYNDTIETISMIATSEYFGEAAVTIDNTSIPDDTEIKVWIQTVDTAGDVSLYTYGEDLLHYIVRNLYIYDSVVNRKSIYLYKNGKIEKKKLYIVKSGVVSEATTKLIDSPPETKVEYFNSTAGEAVVIEKSIDGLAIAGTMTAKTELKNPYVKWEANGVLYRINLPLTMMPGDVYDLKTRNLTCGGTEYKDEDIDFPPLVFAGGKTTTITSNGELKLKTYVEA